MLLAVASVALAWFLLASVAALGLGAFIQTEEEPPQHEGSATLLDPSE